MGEGHTHSNYFVSAARPLKCWLQINKRTTEINVCIIKTKTKYGVSKKVSL